MKLVFPFHIKTALTGIQKLKKHVDLLIAVSDARSIKATQVSSELLSSFEKEGVKILNLVSKSDLSDIKGNNVFNFKNQGTRSKILKLIKKTLEIDIYAEQGYKPHFQVLIVGFPNTGKSTLINLLKGKRVAIAENFPGKTKKISKFLIGDNIWVYDSPGIFTAGKSNLEIMEKLFLLNSVPSTISDYSGLLKWSYDYLYKHYYSDLKKLLGDAGPGDYYVFLECLAKRYNFKFEQDQWDLNRAEDKFLNLLREGKIKLNWDIE